ncbi:AAA family ATPase [Streptomyces sp. NPDC005146]
MRTDSATEARAILITGTVGAGKTSVAGAAGDLLTGAGVPNAVIDMDWLCRTWPAPADDRFNFALLLRNLRCMVGNYLDAGVTRLVLAGVVEDAEDRKQCEQAVGVGLSVCRLRVELPVVRQRLSRRHADEPEALRWHLDRSGELDGVLDRSRVEDFTFDATHHRVDEAAASVLEAAGWR